MLVVLYFHQIGYSPIEIALLFLFYEFFGMITNLTGGWLGARIGLNKTMHIGLFLQLIALSMLLVPVNMLTVIWVMCAQALSGIAKDLNKMSAKSSIKLVVEEGPDGKLFRWVAGITGSKNAMKGLGFFLGGLLLLGLGFQGAIYTLLAPIVIAVAFSLALLRKELGKTTHKPKFREVFSASPAVNRLSAARFFLFGSRAVSYTHLTLPTSDLV